MSNEHKVRVSFILIDLTAIEMCYDTEQWTHIQFDFSAIETLFQWIDLLF